MSHPNFAPPRTFCLGCQAAMEFVMDNKRSWLLKCRSCHRLALVEKETGVIVWYQPDVALQAIHHTSKKG